MVRPRRIVQAAAEESTTPPEALTATQQIARVVRAAGNNLYLCSLAGGRELLVELAPRFRSTLWMRRGGYVLVDTAPGAARDNKIGGVVENVVRDEKRWRKCAYWPAEFPKVSLYEPTTSLEPMTSLEHMTEGETGPDGTETMDDDETMDDETMDDETMDDETMDDETMDDDDTEATMDSGALDGVRSSVR